MREIKFRAWDKWHTRCEDDPSSMVEETHRVMIKLNGDVYNSEYGDDQNDRYIIMQYTGLHDKNGVEIYEGDIVQDCEGNTGEVSYIEDHCQFLINMGEGIDLQEIGSWAEVIGNIYEHSYLLDNKEQK